ncbi:MAG: hypothetical protein JSS99_13160 [Actinobacteria bacterium]|nr:hypothetical protein [Actinomycetota bacterium]
MATASASHASRRDTAVCTPVEVAWLALLPCTLLVLAAMLLLGPPLGRAVFAPQGVIFFPHALPAVLPEPTEHARYLIALLGPVLLAGAVLVSVRRSIKAPPRTTAILVRAVQALLIALMTVCVWIQHTALLDPWKGPITRRGYFTPATLVVAVAITAAITAVLSRPAAFARTVGLLREAPVRRRAALTLAVLTVTMWLLTAVNSDATIGAAAGVVGANVSIWLDEAMSVLDGQGPLVHLHAQYAQLWPYASAGAMALLGTSVSVFLATLLAGTAAAMLAVFAVLRRLTLSSLAALALFVPFVATSFFHQAGSLDNRYSPANLFSLFPLRYGAPYVLLWLLVRHLDGARPRHRALLFLLGGLATINNVEFGVPCLLATVAAFALTDWPLSRQSAGHLARDVALGLLGSVAAVAALTLAVAGSLPHFGLALTFVRMFGIEGFGMMPMRPLGLHVALFATFVAAIATAAVWRTRGHDPRLIAALIWIGTFGLGAGGYFVGRSHPEVLIALFSAWTLALGLLLVAIVRSAAASPRWRPSGVQLAVFFGYGLAVCSIAQTPTPWSQVDRLGRPSPQPVLHNVAQEQALARETSPDEPVAILAPVGHRLAYDVGIDDVAPYSDTRFIAPRQLADTIAALRAARGSRVFVQEGSISPEEVAQLQAAGFRAVGFASEAALVIFEDTQAAGG